MTKATVMQAKWDWEIYILHNIEKQSPSNQVIPDYENAQKRQTLFNKQLKHREAHIVQL